MMQLRGCDRKLAMSKELKHLISLAVSKPIRFPSLFCTIHRHPLPTARSQPRHVRRYTMASPNTTATPLQKPIRLACIQLASGTDKAKNLAHARDKVLEASKPPYSASVVVLPECFNSPYGTGFFPQYAETVLPSPPTESSAPSWHALSAMAREAGVFLVGGSIPERDPSDPSRLYNTSLVFSPEGKLLATHRKMHLFDIDIPGGITFRESDSLSPGNKLTVVELEGLGRIGLAICYDVRFPELATIAARKYGCFALVYPGAFNLTTGPLHWLLLARARAVDNQVYVAMCSPARDMNASYHAYGHSAIVDPMARVLAEAEEGEEIIVAELKNDDIVAARRGIPLETQRRFDVYPDLTLGKVETEKL